MNASAATIMLAIAALGAALACSEGSEPSATKSSAATLTPAAADQAAKVPSPPPTNEPDLVEDGKQAYLSTCIACHNPDPKLDGALGPAVAGSSFELLEARVMRAEYPEGYKPKLDTQAMVAMPFLERQLPALAAYLAEP